MQPVFFETPENFRQWLEQNADEEKELLVGFYKTSSGLPSITWSQSVDEALCFGWIDVYADLSMIKAILSVLRRANPIVSGVL
ncbi:MAG: hypothetical protein JKY70_06115 [Mucilaginibacter sp.]|nr:hypothetical protein [Mucilaginibacter sp.]